MLYDEFIRPCTETETEIYNRLQANMSDALFDAIMDYAERKNGIFDMCDRIINDAATVAMIEAEGFTVAETCIWYFIDEA